jgi:hypothetical protein
MHFYAFYCEKYPFFTYFICKIDEFEEKEKNKSVSEVYSINNTYFNIGKTSKKKKIKKLVTFIIKIKKNQKLIVKKKKKKKTHPWSPNIPFRGVLLRFFVIFSSKLVKNRQKSLKNDPKIIKIGPKLAQNGQKWPKMQQNT